jgi:hypothetical protein
MKNNIPEHRLHAILVEPPSGGSAFSTPPQHAFSYCNSFQRHDIKSDFIIVAAGATVLAMASFAIGYFFRIFTWRKDSPVDFFELNGTSGVAVADSAPSATTTPAAMITPASIPESAPGLRSGELTHVTSPIDPSGAPRHARVLASEELLKTDWDSEEDDRAWANL